MPYDTELRSAEKEILFQKYDLIRRTVSARDVGQAFGLETDSHGRCRCPFHNGADRNMLLYREDRGFYCFVCHEHGDCIKLAQELIGDGCRYHEAALQIDKLFNLNIFDKTKPTMRERIRSANFRLRFGGKKT